MIIAIDGTAASGKGTLAKKLASRLNLAHLDTGALYRITGQMLRNRDIAPSDITAEMAAEAAENLDLSLMTDPQIRTAEAGEMASIVAAIPAVREALMAFQRHFAQSPPLSPDGQISAGSILDGRDIGTVILPDADVKFFVNADLDERAKRRWAELKENDDTVSLPAVRDALAARDERDQSRPTAPLKPAHDAIMIDTTNLDVEAMVVFACEHLPK